MSVPLAWLVPRVAREHHLVQAPEPGLTVVFLTFLVPAQGRGGGGVLLIHFTLFFFSSSLFFFSSLLFALQPSSSMTCVRSILFSFHSPLVSFGLPLALLDQGFFRIIKTKGGGTPPPKPPPPLPRPK